MSQFPVQRVLLALSFAIVGFAIPDRFSENSFAQDGQNLLITDSPGFGQKIDLFGENPGGLKDIEPEMIIELVPANGQSATTLTAGDEVILKFTAVIPAGHYTYATKSGLELGSGSTRFVVENATGLEPVDADFYPDRKPKSIFEPEFDQTVHKFEKDVTWSRRYRLLPDTKPQDVQIQGLAEWQVCGDGKCIPTEKPFEVALTFVSAPVSNSAPFTGTFSERPEFFKKPGPALITAQLSPANAQPGEPVVLRVKLQLEEGYHTYSITQKPGNAAIATKIQLKETPGLKPLTDTFTPSKQPEDKVFEQFQQEIHKNEISWTRVFEVAPDTNPGEYSVDVKFTYQVCDESSCYPPKPLSFQLGNLFSPAPAPEAGTVAENSQGGNKPEQKTESVAEKLISGDVSFASPAEGGKGLWYYLLSAFAGGFILNIMPCVLPVLAIKAISFVQQAGEHRGRIVALNLAYTAGVVGVFLLLATMAVFAQMTWGGLFQSTGFNLVMVCLVFSMGLCLLGVFELPIPGFAGAGAGTQQEGLPGAFLTGIFATLLATPCSGPLLGITFGWSVQQPPAIVYLVWGVMGLGMASPYLVFAFFPQAIQKLPSPGNWMVLFKQFSGFALLGACIFMLYFLEEQFLIPALIMMLGLGISLWMVGHMYQHGSPTKTKAMVRTVALLIAGGLGWAGYSMGATMNENELPWQEFSDENLVAAVKDGRTVLVDFTADWCLTCKQNERKALNTRKTLKLVTQNDVAVMKADFTRKDEKIKRWLSRFNSISVPLTVIFPASQPDKPIVIRDTFSEAVLLEKLKGAVSVQPVQQASRPANVAVN